MPAETLIIWAGKFAADFTSSPDYNDKTYQASIDRIMLRDKKSHVLDVEARDNITLLIDENITDQDTWGYGMTPEDLAILKSLIKETDVEVKNYLNRYTDSEGKTLYISAQNNK